MASQDEVAGQTRDAVAPRLSDAEIDTMMVRRHLRWREEVEAERHIYDAMQTVGLTPALVSDLMGLLYGYMAADSLERVGTWVKTMRRITTTFGGTD